MRFVKNIKKGRLIWRTGLLLVVIIMLAAHPFVTATADQFDDQIKVLQQEAEEYQRQANDLRAQADTLQNAINTLNVQQNALQAQISEKEVELEQLKAQIQDTEQKIIQQKASLANNLRTMYIDGDITPLEVIASSKSISDYLDKQEYNENIRTNIQNSLATVKALKTSLGKQKTDVEHALADQKAMQNDLVARTAAKDQLLADTQGQEESYQQLIKQRSGEIENLRAQQREANRKVRRGGIDYSKFSSYPWTNASMSYNDACVYPDGTVGADEWGYCLRQCTSYVAWRLAKSGASKFEYLGHAGSWVYGGQGVSPPDAQPGDVLVLPLGTYGHVMYIEEVNDRGIGISEFNYDWDGRYSERKGSDSITWGEINSYGYKVRRF